MTTEPYYHHHANSYTEKVHQSREILGSSEAAFKGNGLCFLPLDDVIFGGESKFSLKSVTFGQLQPHDDILYFCARPSSLRMLKETFMHTETSHTQHASRFSDRLSAAPLQGALGAGRGRHRRQCRGAQVPLLRAAEQTDGGGRPVTREVGHTAGKSGRQRRVAGVRVQAAVGAY